MGSKGIVASTAAMATLLMDGIGDTIRVSLTPEPGRDRTQEVIVAQEILQTSGIRSFVPMVTACPAAGAPPARCSRNWPTRFNPSCAQQCPSGARSMKRGKPERRGDGLHRQRAGRKQARAYRHFAAGHRRNSHRARFRGRQKAATLRGEPHREEFQQMWWSISRAITARRVMLHNGCIRGFCSYIHASLFRYLRRISRFLKMEGLFFQKGR